MNKTELIAMVAEKASMSKKDAGVAVDSTLRVIVDAMEKGDKVQLVGFGIFETCLLHISPSPRDRTRSRMPPSAR